MCYYKANKTPCICKIRYLVRPCWRATIHQSWNSNPNPIIQPCGIIETATDVPPRSCFQCESLVALMRARTAAKGTRPMPFKRQRQLPRSYLSSLKNPIEAFYRSQLRNPQFQKEVKIQRRSRHRPVPDVQKQLMNTFATAPQNQYLCSQAFTPPVSQQQQQQQPPAQQTDNFYDLLSLSDLSDLPPIPENELDQLTSMESRPESDVEVTANRAPNTEPVEILPDNVTTARASSSPPSEFIDPKFLSSPSPSHDVTLMAEPFDETLLLPDSMSDIFTNFTWSESDNDDDVTALDTTPQGRSMGSPSSDVPPSESLEEFLGLPPV